MDIKMIFCLFKLLTYASAGMYRLQRTSSGLWMPSQMSKRPWRSLRLSRRPPRTTRGSRRPLRSSRRPRRMARGPKRLPQMSKRPPQVTCRCLEGREDRGGRLQGCEDTATFFPDSQCRCTAFSILNSRMQGTGFAGSSHSRIQNRKGRASLQSRVKQRAGMCRRNREIATFPF